MSELTQKVINGTLESLSHSVKSTGNILDGLEDVFKLEKHNMKYFGKSVKDLYFFYNRLVKEVEILEAKFK